MDQALYSDILSEEVPKCGQYKRRRIQGSSLVSVTKKISI